jgi:glycosyltransferase involved in cell wall biosynthesis
VVGNFNPPSSGRKYQAEVLSDAFEVEGASVVRITTQQNRYLRPLAVIAELLRAKGQFDVACVQAFSNGNFVNAAAGILVCRLLRKRVAVVYRGGAAPYFLARAGFVVMPILRRAHAIVVPSGYLERVFSARGLRPRIIPNVINPAAFPFRDRPRFTPKLVWVRHLREGYNPWMAVEVLRIVQATAPEATLTMIGEGGLRSELERRTREEQVSGVTFTGQLPQAEVADQLQRADIFINTTNYDNQPRSLLEAMAAGLPVVSTDVGGVPFLVQHGENGLLVPPGDAHAMARAVERLVNEPAMGRSIVACARKRLEQFTWQSVGRAWLDVLSGETTS